MSHTVEPCIKTRFTATHPCGHTHSTSRLRTELEKKLTIAQSTSRDKFVREAATAITD
jgi:hypothetical protein